MKFVIAAVVVLAVASGVQSSWGVGLGGPLLAQGPALLGWGHGLPAAIDIAGGPIISPAAHISAAVAVAPHAGIIPGHAATYVAKTRGAVHTAPLPGHIQSAASVNLAPAPGTW